MGRRGEFRYDEHLKDHYLEQVLDTPKFKAFYLKRQGYGRMESCLLFFSPEGISIHGDLCHGNDSRNSGVHAYGYGLEWFAGRLSWSYLCEKFLTKEWHSELAVEDCRDRAEAIMRGEENYFTRDKELEKLLARRQDISSEIWGARQDIQHQNESTDPVPDLRKVIARARAEGAELKKKVTECRAVQAQKYLDLADRLDGGEMGVESFGSAMSEIDGSNWYEDAPGYGYLPRSRYLLVGLQKKFSELYAKMNPVPLAAGGEA